MSSQQNSQDASGIDFSKAKWFKAEKSQTSNCVEVAFLDEGYVAVRDTKNREGGTQMYTPAEWDAFLDGVRNGEFDMPAKGAAL